ncbi:MAG: aminotransferase class V-fold PLP-dependent enzyme [Erysipelotrichaceae bacterium]|jgi:hypothetical protein|nr:aminotransferase class V-fold PLP-dependent enzyme [Erysipelotrichaceae bacterium]
MKAYPLESISLEEAMKKQFKMVDCMSRHFSGSELLSRGDLGVRQPDNEPLTTVKAEAAIADFFDSEAAILVRGAGTGAIRYALASVIRANEKILVHRAPVYSTTKTSFEMLGLIGCEADFNDLNEVRKVLKENDDIRAVLIQHSRQLIEDSYNLKEVIAAVKETKDVPVIIDDNYAVMKVSKIGCELGADLSCFSSFKLQGPEGIGVITGKKGYIDRIRKMHYSGGCQTQGHEALDVLRGLVYAPVSLAIQAQVSEEILQRLKAGEVKGVRDVTIANAQSKVLIIELEKENARQVLKEAQELGALPNPVGAESRYEMTPLFYKVSGTFLAKDPTLIDKMIRVNPNRAGADTVIRILKESIERSA